ncbi:MAG: TlpA family protein disulfide reductase [Draconibacterium sp.]|nr:TlpA family protein disulfide reductase [Draconibacterium sp.]
MKTKQLLFILTLLFFTVNVFAQDKFTFVKKGDTAPNFSIEMQDGTTKQLSDLKGKVVWVNFFATWCGPCRVELPHLEKDVYNKFKNRDDFEVLVIGREHDWATVNKFKSENNYVLPFYPDPKREIFSKYAKQNIPRNFIIDKEGKIAVVSIGFNKDEFSKIILHVEELLN